MCYYMGIDHGETGSIVVIDSDKNIILLEDMPTTKGEIDPNKLKPIFEKLKGLNISSYIEKVITIYTYDPKQKRRVLRQSGKSLVTQATGLGYLVAFCVAYDFSINQIMASEWQKYFGLYGQKGKTPNVTKAKEIFPDAELYKGRKMMDGRADALLIAEYLRRQHEKTI